MLLDWLLQVQFLKRFLVSKDPCQTFDIEHEHDIPEIRKRLKAGGPYLNIELMTRVCNILNARLKYCVDR